MKLGSSAAEGLLVGRPGGTPVVFLLAGRWEGLAAQICEEVPSGVGTWAFRGLFSRVLCAGVRCKLVECSLEGKGETRGWRLQMRGRSSFPHLLCDLG